MTREQFRAALHAPIHYKNRTPMHFGSYLWKGNKPEPWGEYNHYNPNHLPVVIESKGETNA